MSARHLVAGDGGTLFSLLTRDDAPDQGRPQGHRPPLVLLDDLGRSPARQPGARRKRHKEDGGSPRPFTSILAAVLLTLKEKRAVMTTWPHTRARFPFSRFPVLVRLARHAIENRRRRNFGEFFGLSRFFTSGLNPRRETQITFRYNMCR